MCVDVCLWVEERACIVMFFFFFHAFVCGSTVDVGQCSVVCLCVSVCVCVLYVNVKRARTHVFVGEIYLI